MVPLGACDESVAHRSMPFAFHSFRVCVCTLEHTCLEAPCELGLLLLEDCALRLGREARLVLQFGEGVVFLVLGSPGLYMDQL